MTVSVFQRKYSCSKILQIDSEEYRQVRIKYHSGAVLENCTVETQKRILRVCVCVVVVVVVLFVVVELHVTVSCIKLVGFAQQLFCGKFISATTV